MIWLKNIFEFALVLCRVIGLAFMIGSTFLAILVIISIICGNISIHVTKDETGEEMENKMAGENDIRYGESLNDICENMQEIFDCVKYDVNEIKNATNVLVELIKKTKEED